MSVDTKQLGRQVKDTYIEALPALLADYLTMVRSSEDPDDHRKAVELGIKMHGLIEQDKGAGLPVFNITFGAGFQVEQITAARADAVVIDMDTLDQDISVPLLTLQPLPDTVDTEIDPMAFLTAMSLPSTC